MNSDEYKFELSRNIDYYLGVLSKLYTQDGNKLLQSIIVNSQIRVHEEWSNEDWDGGRFGHAVYFSVPEAIFLKTVKQKDKFQEQIMQDINNAHNIQNEL